MKLITRFILLLLFLDFGSQMFLTAFPNLIGSDYRPEFTVKWISTYSKAKDFHIDKSFLGKVFDFVVGSDEFKLSKPMNVFAYDTNRMIILDQGHRRIISYDKENDELAFFDNNKNILPSLVAITEWKDGLFLVTDSHNGQLYILDREEQEIKPFLTDRKLEQPTGIAYNHVTDEIIISETREHRLIVLNSKGELLRTVGTRGIGKSEFNFPTFLAFANGILYVVDAMNFRVQVFNDDYQYITEFGEQGDGSGYLASPKGIAVDSHGHIYLADALFHAVQVFDIEGNYLYGIGGKGRDDGHFWMPSGVYINNEDQIFIADSYNSRIQVFKLFELD